MELWKHVIAVLGLGVICGFWIWLQSRWKLGEGGGCGACGGCGCQRSCTMETSRENMEEEVLTEEIEEYGS